MLNGRSLLITVLSCIFGAAYLTLRGSHTGFSLSPAPVLRLHSLLEVLQHSSHTTSLFTPCTDTAWFSIPRLCRTFHPGLDLFVSLCHTFSATSISFKSFFAMSFHCLSQLPKLGRLRDFVIKAYEPNVPTFSSSSSPLLSHSPPLCS